MQLSIIIVNWRVRDLLHKCLRSLQAAIVGLEAEVIVVDNASDDGSAEMVRAEFPEVKLIASQDNLGFAKGNNLGIRQSCGEFVMLLNPDTEVPPDALIKMLVYIKNNPHIAILGPKLINTDGTLQPSVRRFPDIASQLMIMLKLWMLHRNSRVMRRYWASDFDYARPQSCDQIMGAAMLMRRTTFDNIGLLDEGFFVWYEEVDLCRRAVNAGLEVWYAPVATITHHGAQSFGQLLAPRRQLLFNRAMRRYFSKHSGPLSVIVLYFFQPLSMLLALGAGAYLKLKNHKLFSSHAR